MLIVDEYIEVPALNMLFIFRQIHEPSAEELVGSSSELRAEYADLSSKRKTGEISEAEFHTRGRKLLRRLQTIERLTSREGRENDDEL